MVAARLVHEDGNSHDPLAIRVDVDGHTVGYHTRAAARIYRRWLAAQGGAGRTATCSAVIVGGWKHRAQGPGALRGQARPARAVLSRSAAGPRAAGAPEANETCPRARKDQERSVTRGASPEGLDVGRLSGATLTPDVSLTVLSLVNRNVVGTAT